MQNKKEKGFTLLEILLVIAAIGILAAIVLIAINPNKQIAQARNTARKVDINTLEKALRQYSIDNAGQLPNGILNQYKVICRQGITDPSCINLDVLIPTYIAAIPRDTQSNTINTGYSLAVNPNNNNVSIIANLAEQVVEISINKFNDGSGNSALLAANSCQSILSSGYSTGNGVYWINLPTSGPTQTYCLMDTLFDGGGWMMAMKATNGTTFNYNSSYWTTANTLNPNDTTRNNADAKFNTMNYFQAKDMMAIWPDIPNGGSIPASTLGWTWLENNFYAGNRIVPIALWSTVDKYFIRDAKIFTGWAASPFSSQVDVRFYGFNYVNSQNLAKVRWGFGWNENGGGLYPNGNMGSDDVSGGIGMTGTQQGQVNYSAGDYIGCCQDNTGINRSARVELYIR
jgi:type IV pilus assembly protein PilA